MTLDVDVAGQLREEMRRTRRSFKETVNAVLRLGLDAARRPKPVKPFVVRARPLSARPGVDYDKIADLLEQAEGPLHR